MKKNAPFKIASAGNCRAKAFASANERPPALFDDGHHAVAELAQGLRKQQSNFAGEP
jgi:hypothetical protein